MSMRINHNILSLNAYRNLVTNQSALDSNVNRLSSGLRINSGADDPAGLGISERYRAQIAGMTEAEKNAHYNINLLQTADGSLAVIDEKLIRLRAIAIQSANGALDPRDRKVANVEYQQLVSEITRIAGVTHYNGLRLLDGSFSSNDVNDTETMALSHNATSIQNPGHALKFHIGANNVEGLDYYYVNLGDMRSDALGIYGSHVADTASAQAAIDMIDSAINSKDTQRSFIGSLMERLQNTITELQISHENAQASESMIRDADMAREMSEFTKNQILMQTGVSMLSQANMVPSMVAGLLG